MNTQHTPGSWRSDYAWQINTLSDGDSGCVKVVCSFPDTEQGSADKNHVLACVNACAGISENDIDLITKGGGFQQITTSWSAALREAEQQRDELRRAALQVVWQVRTKHLATNKTDAANKLANAMNRLEAIAKHKGMHEH